MQKRARIIPQSGSEGICKRYVKITLNGQAIPHAASTGAHGSAARSRRIDLDVQLAGIEQMAGMEAAHDAFAAVQHVGMALNEL